MCEFPWLVVETVDWLFKLKKTPITEFVNVLAVAHHKFSKTTAASVCALVGVMICAVCRIEMSSHTDPNISPHAFLMFRLSMMSPLPGIQRSRRIDSKQHRVVRDGVLWSSTLSPAQGSYLSDRLITRSWMGQGHPAITSRHRQSPRPQLFKESFHNYIAYHFPPAQTTGGQLHKKHKQGYNRKTYSETYINCLTTGNRPSQWEQDLSIKVLCGWAKESSVAFLLLVGLPGVEFSCTWNV